jgi:dihydroxy-acid dehydratase
VSFARSFFLYAAERSWSCNRHLLGLGQRVKASLSDAGIIGYQFGTVGVSDGISMGTRGMSYSLQSRDLIADQVETAAGGHWLDGMAVIPGCDKNMPGVLMARTHLDIYVLISVEAL